MRRQCTTHSFFSLSNAEILTAVEKACNAVLMTDFKLMVAQQSGKGPNLKVVKWW